MLGVRAIKSLQVFFNENPYMNSLYHALNIGTLAVWLSVAGFGSVGLMVPGWEFVPKPAHPEILEVLTVTPDVTVGADSPSISPEESAPAPSEAQHLPPAIPDIATTTPLPEIPDLTPTLLSVRQPTTARKSSSASRGNPTPSTTPGNGKSGTGISKSNRFAAGHMPAPPYPPYSRRNRQEGTVVVQFTINSEGHVTAAFAKKPSPWPLLNQTAVRTVLSWNFPPGNVTTLERPIIFKLK